MFDPDIAYAKPVKGSNELYFELFDENDTFLGCQGYAYIHRYKIPTLDELAQTIEKEVMQQAKPVFHSDKYVLPTDPAERKAIPLATGCFDYFPNALAEIAKISKQGNDQHNPGQPLHWARGKSMDHADTILRHFAERGSVDVDGTRHSAKLAWRALALLQEELEQAGAPMARGARVDE